MQGRFPTLVLKLTIPAILVYILVMLSPSNYKVPSIEKKSPNSRAKAKKRANIAKAFQFDHFSFVLDKTSALPLDNQQREQLCHSLFPCRGAEVAVVGNGPLSDVQRKEINNSSRYETVIRFNHLSNMAATTGITMDAKKVKAIIEWPAPTKVAELQSFLGLTSYYRRFVDSYALRTDPLTRLLKKEVPFVWGPEQEASFVDLKRAITTAPVLVAPDPDKPFVVVTDASGVALGAVLMQDQGKGLQPLCFASRKLCDAETRYPTHERELLGIVYALKQWRHYLLNAVRSVVYTDHHPLKYFETQPKLSLRQARWMELLQEYNVYLDYLPGKANVVADALSRRPDYLNILIAENSTDSQVETVVLNEELIKRIKDAYGLTDESKQIMDTVAHSSTSPYKEENGLYYKNDRVYVPEDEALRQLIVSEHHDSVLSGHLGQDKTLELVQRSFFWPFMELYVRYYVETCPVCALSKNENKKPAGLHQPFRIPEKNWQVVSLDYVTGLPKTERGNDCMLVLVDKLSKFLVILPTTTQVTAMETARLYFDHIVCEHGLQEVLISDRDPRFTSEFWTELHKLLGTKLNISTAYRPQTDGQTERANRTIEEMLRSYCMDNQKDWDLYVKPVAFAYNNSKNSSAFELVLVSFTVAFTTRVEFELGLVFWPTERDHLLSLETSSSSFTVSLLFVLLDSCEVLLNFQCRSDGRLVGEAIITSDLISNHPVEVGEKLICHEYIINWCW
jgi:transposase InsO family protein